MNNKFGIEQISTDQFVLKRQNRHSTEYLTNELDVIVLDFVGANTNVVYNSLNVARQVLQTYNSKQLLNEVKADVGVDKGLSIKSIKFKYKVAEDGCESTVGVDSKAWEYLKSNSKDAVYTINTSGLEEVVGVTNEG